MGLRGIFVHLFQKHHITGDSLDGENQIRVDIHPIASGSGAFEKGAEFSVGERGERGGVRPKGEFTTFFLFHLKKGVCVSTNLLLRRHLANSAKEIL